VGTVAAVVSRRRPCPPLLLLLLQGRTTARTRQGAVTWRVPPKEPVPRFEASTAAPVAAEADVAE